MKKYLIIIILILTFSGVAFSQDVETYEDYTPASADQDVLFKPFLPDVVKPADVVEDSSDFYFGDSRQYNEIDPDNMPLFKQLRLKMSNKILEVQYREPKNNEAAPKWKFWNKNSKNEPQETEIPKDELSNVLKDETSADVSEETLSLSTGIRESVTEKEMILDSEDISFDEESGDMIAKGRPKLDVPAQNMRVIADEITYNEYSNILKGIGNVIVYRDGIPTFGDYLEIDMNEETMFMDNVVSKTPKADSTAEKAVQKDGLLILTKGSFVSDESQVSRIVTRVAGPDFSSMIVDPDSQALLFGNPEGNNLVLKADSIYVDARKNHDVFRAKNIKIYHKDKYLTRIPSMTAYTNKKHTYFEANYPEFGSTRKTGMFAGPGFTFGGPGSSIIKVIPFLNYKNKFGIGGMVKYVNSYNKTYIGYGSANEIFFMNGKQILDDNLTLSYGANTYNDEWFLGGRMAKYLAELNYDKSYYKKDFLGKGMPLTFRHRIGFGIMRNDDQNSYGERLKTSNMSTTRTRYMAGINQVLYSYRNVPKRVKLYASFVMQGSAALYGTGDTQFIGRMGPTVTMQYKNWMQSAGYFITGYDDHTPMPVYDSYRYGRQSVYLTEAFRINKYLSVGWAGYVNLSNDSPNGKMFQENAFLVSVGPDDFKVIFGYDFTRERTYFGVNVAFDSKGTKVHYERMEIKNPERLGKKYTPEDKEENERQVAFVKSTQRPELPSSKRSKNDNSRPPVLQYAEVIDIEDPLKERID